MKHLRYAAAVALALLPASAFADPAQRIITIGGSVTEIAVALGAESRLIARDTTSSYPASVEKLPDVGYIRALSPEGVLSLNPDLIISEAGAGPREAVDVLRAAGVPFLEMPGGAHAEGVLAKITAVAEALDLAEEGKVLRDEVAQGLEQAKARADAVTEKKRVLFILGLGSGKVNGAGRGSSPEGIIEMAGAVNAVDGFEGYKQLSDEAILTAAPDVILVMDRVGRLAVLKDDILAHPALGQTPAAKSGQIVAMDGLLLLGFGPRTPLAINTLHDAIYGK